MPRITPSHSVPTLHHVPRQQPAERALLPIRLAAIARIRENARRDFDLSHADALMSHSARYFIDLRQDVGAPESVAP